jgi:hypothetical protein
MVFRARVPRQRLHGCAFVDLGDPLPTDEAATRLSLLRMPDLIEHAPIRVGPTLYFADGVTADWLLPQVAEALRMAAQFGPRAHAGGIEDCGVSRAEALPHVRRPYGRPEGRRHISPYSARKATIGSTAAALRAGR